MCMCVYVGLSAAYVSVCMCVYVCVYVCICVYMYVCICMRVCMYICVYACMHICVIIIINSHGLSARRCPMSVSSTSSVRRHLCIFVYVCIIIHVYVLGEMSDGKMSYSKLEEELSGGELSGGKLSGGLLSYTPIVDCQTSDLCELQQNPHACMDDRSSLDLEAEHGVTMDDMYCRGSFQNTCIDVIHEEIKTHEVYNCD